MNLFKLVLCVLSLLLSLTFQEAVLAPYVRATPVIFQGDLTLNGNNVTVIEGNFYINGSIYVEDNATLILRNAIVNFTQTSYYQYGLIFQNSSNGNPRLQAENATLASNLAFPIRFYENSSADTFDLYSQIGDFEALGFSNISLSSSTIRKLSCQDNSLATVTNSEVTVACDAMDNSLVVLSNCEIGSLKLYESATVTVSDSSVSPWLEIQSSSVNCSLADFSSGLINSWNFLHNCSVVIGTEGYAPNLTVTDTYVANWYFIFRGSANATIENSQLVYLDCTNLATVNVMNSYIQGIYAYQAANIHIADSTLIFLNAYGTCQVHILDMNVSTLQSQQSSRLWLVNATSDFYYIEDQSEVYVNWILDVHVTDSIDQDVPSANVTAYYPNATIAESMLTDETGWTQLALVEKMMNATGEYPTGNYTLEATYNIYSDETTVNLTTNQQVTLILDSFIIPELSPLFILPLFLAGSLLIALTYRRRRA